MHGYSIAFFVGGSAFGLGCIAFGTLMGGIHKEPREVLCGCTVLCAIVAALLALDGWLRGLTTTACSGILLP